MRRRFVIVDRDGTINVERHYLSNPDDLELLPGVGSGLRRLRALGLGIVVATNQSAIARGFFDRTRLDEIHDRLRLLLFEEGIELDGIYVCPHHPKDHCRCRKPAPGLIEQAIGRHGFDSKMSYMIGDKSSDIGCGQGVGAFTILVQPGGASESPHEVEAVPDAVVANLDEASKLIRSKLATAGDKL